MGKITAAWYNSVVAMYNGPLGTTIANATVGQKIASSLFVNLIEKVQAQATATGYDVHLPPLTAVAQGQQIQLLQFGAPVALAAASQTVRYKVPGSYTFTVPTTGVSTVQLNWVVGGGGGGGYGSQVQNGGGGGGGGAGGYGSNIIINVNPGDKLTFVVGTGGQGGTTGAGTAGGSTTVSINGVLAYTATGGQGGAAANTTKSAINAPGGIGGAWQGTITGLTGQTGPGGTSDTASCYGGAGAPSAVQGAYGGAGGTTAGGGASTGGSSGSNGVGTGAGGGGGGSADRTSPGAWFGGDGAPGFVEFTWPAQSGSGTPSQNNSTYNVNALLSSGAQGGGYSGGPTGVVGSGKNGSGVTP